MSSRWPVRRPTEAAAICAAARSGRQATDPHLILADMVTAHRAGDQHGVNLCAHRLVRASEPQVGEA